MKHPLISVVIINYNGKKWLKKCLNSLTKQTYKNFEIIFVDNASKDKSVSYVRANFPKIKIIINKKNYGFAKGNNIGVKKAKGEYIVLLNNDTYVEKDYLENFIKAFDEIPHLAVAQSKIVLMDNPKRIDACGSFWTNSTFLYHYGFGKDAALAKYNNAYPIFTVKGASMIIKKSIIDTIGLFDDDFWCYYEETDFCHRAWIAGYECWYYPGALAYHHAGGTSKGFDNAYIQFHNFKNKLLSFLKNYQIRSLFFILPSYFLVNLALMLYYFIQLKFGHIFSLFKAFYWNIIHFSGTMIKRQVVQSVRVKSDKELTKKTTINPTFSYYVGLSKGLENYKDIDLPYEK